MNSQYINRSNTSLTWVLSSLAVIMTVSLTIFLPPTLSIMTGLAILSLVVFIIFKPTVKTIFALLLASIFFGSLLSYSIIGVQQPVLPQIFRAPLLLSLIFIIVLGTKNKIGLINKRDWDLYLFVFWMFISAPVALNPEMAIIYSLWIGIAFVFLSYCVKYIESIEKQLKIMFVPLSIITILSFILSVSGVDSALTFRGIQQVWRGVFASINYFSLVSVLAIALGFALLNFKNKSKRYTLFLLFVIIVNFANVFMSYSRASTLAAIGCLLAFFLFSKLRFTLKLFSISTMLILGFIFMQDSFSSILDRLSTSLNDVDQRLTIWKSNFDFLVKYPFNGTGLTGATSIQETAGFSTHNSFLQIPVETGIVGTAIFSIILIRMIFGMWKMRRFNRYIFSAYITILTAIIINGMAESQILLPGTVFFYPFWLIILSLRANISNTKKPENVT